MQLARFQAAKTFILYDAHSVCDALPASQIDPALFSPAYWRQHGGVVGEAPGRGTSLFVQAGSQQWVLRHYRRGGLIGRVIRDRYLWTGLERTRAFRELRLTAELHARGLPVPPPVAACVWRHGLSYRAALITVRLAGTRALAERLADADATLLERVGASIARFHAAGLDHVDLNARNLLVDATDRVWLIDLDRCRLRPPGAWQAANLDRLARSLAKFDAPPGAMETIRRGYSRA
ncbi:3-deoxy-D-manno-octulosonic acid kinase [Halomonas sp. 1513]|nr:3-deoxy-D-manno-octulosonic acid kinase [Halomonas sp. 1513]APX91477.1 3-deoxy-D-manno-octulosonic acid kinase [Halomonas sp. 1513]